MCEFRDQVERRKFYLERYSPKGSCHLDEPTWVTHLLGKAFRIDEVECIRHAKTHQPKRPDETYKYICKESQVITGVNDNKKQQRYTICVPPSCDLNAPRGGTIFIIKSNKAGTFTQEHCSVFVGRWLQCSAAAPRIEVSHLFRWYTHTHSSRSTWETGALRKYSAGVDPSCP